MKSYRSVEGLRKKIKIEAYKRDTYAYKRDTSSMAYVKSHLYD